MKEKDNWQTVMFWKNQFLNGLANIYVPWSNGINEGQQDIIKHIIVEVINLTESLAISIWAAKSSLGLEFLDNNMQKFFIAIWGCYGCYIAIKLGFFLFLHPWSHLKNGILAKHREGKVKKATNVNQGECFHFESACK